MKNFPRSERGARAQDPHIRRFDQAPRPKAGLLAIALMMSSAMASAQSSSTIFGTVDLNISHYRSSGVSKTAMEQGGNMLPSRIGFRGVEDMGGGLYASYWLEGAVDPESGGQSLNFQRRSTVSLTNTRFGEIRLGRDYVPTFWNVSSFAPFGTVGVGGSSNTVEAWPVGLGGARTLVRANNSVGYFLPRDLGGVYGQVMASLSEGSRGTGLRGARLGYAAGPIDVAAAYSTTSLEEGRLRVVTIGGSYDFGPVKLMGNFLQQRARDDRQNVTLVGFVIPVGVGLIKGMVAHSDRSGPGIDGDDARQWAVGYVHNLSKRTSLYAAYARIHNKGNAAYVTGDASPVPSPGGNTTGLQAGITHHF